MDVGTMTYPTHLLLKGINTNKCSVTNVQIELPMYLNTSSETLLVQRHFIMPTKRCDSIAFCYGILVIAVHPFLRYLFGPTCLRSFKMSTRQFK